jgi:hypothetical protein
LLRLLANLDEVDVPYLCGSYLRLVVVRAGRLEKVMLDMWEPYVGFVEGVRAKCRGSKRGLLHAYPGSSLLSSCFFAVLIGMLPSAFGPSFR